MKALEQPTISLCLYTDSLLLPVATAFVEKGAAAMGLGRHESLSLTLATEEIFSCICRQGQPDHEVGIDLVNGGYYVKVEFELRGTAFDMHAFNLTACVLPDDDKSLQDLGLLIASRSADRFYVSQETAKGLCLSLVKEKVYPPAEDGPVGRPVAMGRYEIRPPDAEELKLLARGARRGYPGRVVPGQFSYPGKVVDMVASGEYHAAVAVGDAGRIGGGIVWHRMGAKMVECYGPYTFTPQPDEQMAVDLLEGCIHAIARTPHTLGLISRLAPRSLPLAHFEYLGSLTVSDENGAPVELPAYFRQMHEDSGTSSWSHPSLEPFLREQYHRLVLPREIRLTENSGETKSPCSVLRTEIDRLRSEVILRPVVPGVDQEQNLRNHIALLRKESFSNIFFAIDLARPHEVEFTPALLSSGFQARLVMPYGGEGDLVIFQLLRSKP